MRGFLFTAIFATSCLPLSAQASTPAVPTYAPVPSTGLGPMIPPSVGYRVESFGQGAYMITDGIYQSLFFVANDSVIAVDAPPTIGHNLLRGIRAVTDLPISHMVYSHSHADHIEGAYLLINQDTIVIAQEETKKQLVREADESRPVPNVTFTENYELCVDNQTLQLSYKGINHDPGNIFIYAPIQRILMLVDVIYPGWVPFARLAESEYIPGWIDAHDQILEYDFDHIVNGHLNRAGTREDVLIQKEYVLDLFNNCAEAIRLTGEPPSSMNPLSANTLLPLIEAANPNNSWAAVNYLDDQITSWCANKTNEKWLGRLAGADVYGYSNADAMSESVRLDFGILGAVGVKN